jgi:hypothetical protein
MEKVEGDGPWIYPALHCGRHPLREIREALGMRIFPGEDPDRIPGIRVHLSIRKAKKALAEIRP